MKEYKDLWGDIDLSSIESEPLELLKRQASLIKDKTKSLIIGDIETTTDEEIIYNTFYLIAPSLDNYRYALFKTASASRPYPIFVYDNSQDEKAIKVQKPRQEIENPFGMNPILLSRKSAEEVVATVIGSRVRYVGKSIPEPDHKAANYKEFEAAISKIISSKEARSVIHSILAQIKIINNKESEY